MKFQKITNFQPPNKPYQAQYKDEPTPIFYWSDTYAEEERIMSRIPTDQIKQYLKETKKYRDDHWESDGLDRDEWIDIFTTELKARVKGT